MTVHSTQLGGGSYASGSYHSVYTVPAGKRTIVKGLWIRNTNAAAQVVAINCDTVSFGNVYFYYHLAAAGSSGDSQYFDIWIVLNAGDVLKVGPGASNADVIAAGAELTL